MIFKWFLKPICAGPANVHLELRSPMLDAMQDQFVAAVGDDIYHEVSMSPEDLERKAHEIFDDQGVGVRLEETGENEFAGTTNPLYQLTLTQSAETPSIEMPAFLKR